jgi:hypothetical protein
MRFFQPIEDVPYGSYERCCNMVLAPVGSLVPSNAIFSLQLAESLALGQQIRIRVNLMVLAVIKPNEIPPLWIL